MQSHCNPYTLIHLHTHIKQKLKGIENEINTNIKKRTDRAFFEVQSFTIAFMRVLIDKIINQKK